MRNLKSLEQCTVYYRKSTSTLKIQREFEKSSRSPLATLLPQNRQWVFFKDPTAWRPDSPRVLTTSRGTATFPATTTSCQCATAQHTPHPLQRAPRAPCCRAYSCPIQKHRRKTPGPRFLKSRPLSLFLFSSLCLQQSFKNRCMTYQTWHRRPVFLFPSSKWGLWEMDCTSKQEQIWTPAIIHHPSQRSFITSCAYNIRKYRLLEEIKEHLRCFHGNILKN